VEAVQLGESCATSFAGQASRALKASGEALLVLPERSSHCMESCQTKNVILGGTRPTRTPLQCASGAFGPSGEIPCSDGAHTHHAVPMVYHASMSVAGPDSEDITVAGLLVLPLTQISCGDP